jgi:hypothetical protein
MSDASRTTLEHKTPESNKSELEMLFCVASLVLQTSAFHPLSLRFLCNDKAPHHGGLLFDMIPGEFPADNTA